MSGKKHRNITVDENKFAYTIGVLHESEELGKVRELRIWENKQIILRKELTYIEEITPEFVAKVIKKDVITK